RRRDRRLCRHSARLRDVRHLPSGQREVNPRLTGRGAEGDTLVELLLSVVILGIAVTALLGLMRLSVAASGLHHRQSIAGTMLDDFAEYMGSQTSNPYAACPNATTSYNAVVSTFTGALSNSGSKYYQPEFK